MTAQTLSLAESGTTLDLDVTLAVSGKGVTQGRAVGRVGGREILTVNAALGQGQLQMEGTWVERPEVAEPPQVPRKASARHVRQQQPALCPGPHRQWPDDRRARRYAWKRFVLILGTCARPSRTVGREHSRSLVTTSQEASPNLSDFATTAASSDNTTRVARLVPTEWILCDIGMQALARGFAHMSSPTCGPRTAYSS